MSSSVRSYRSAQICVPSSPSISCAVTRMRLPERGHIEYTLASMKDKKQVYAGALCDQLGEWLRDGFTTVFGDLGEVRATICAVATANPEFGDYQCNAAMGLAKVLKQAPRKIAEQAVAGMLLKRFCHECCRQAVFTCCGFDCTLEQYRVITCQYRIIDVIQVDFKLPR